ncbi:MAG: ribosome silencing factor [Candidatus Omnitrophica bacterium]|nr:ribosome silencing factor [Candidatus Omnitrophota bacterium]
MTSRQIALKIAGFASDKKAEDIVILDMKDVANFCDCFVICSGNNDRQVRAIADNILDEMKKKGLPITYKTGLKSADWIVLDAGDVVCHIFQKQLREFYNLEHLWQEAEQIPYND